MAVANKSNHIGIEISKKTRKYRLATVEIMDTKECPKCHRFLPLTEEYFYVLKKTKKFFTYCKECRKQDHKREYAAIKKRCLIDPEFRDKIKKRNREYSKTWYYKLKLENPELLKQKCVEKAKKRIEQNRQYQKKYYQDHKHQRKIDNEFSDIEIAILKQSYFRLKADIPELLISHSVKSIEKKAYELGLN